MSEEALVTPGGIQIPPAALSWKFSRSGGPGGQHVNTSDTRVELVCDLERAELEASLLGRLAERLGTEVRVVSDGSRSQLQNRAEARRRLAARLDGAARRVRSRRPTVPSRSARENRLTDKRRLSDRKDARRVRPDDLD
ncbi:MAG: peptide chain release factor-like protein [Acidimicrobiales bacterium]